MKVTKILNFYKSISLESSSVFVVAGRDRLHLNGVRGNVGAGQILKRILRYVTRSRWSRPKPGLDACSIGKNK